MEITLPVEQPPVNRTRVDANVASLNRVPVRKLSLFLLCLAIGLAPLPQNIVAPRNFNADANIFAIEGGSGGGALFILRAVFGACVLLLSGAAIFSVRRPRASAANRWLWLAAIGFGLSYLAGGLLGARPRLTPYVLVFPLSFTALMFLQKNDVGWFVTVARRVSLLYIYGSLAAVLFLPSVAIEYPYWQGWLFPIRLHGIATHANDLAPLAILFILLDRIERRPLTFIRSLNILAAVTVFVLTQSKTVWVASLASILIVSWLRLGLNWRVLSTSIAVILIGLGVGLLVASDPAASLASNPYAMQVTTLTGRTKVWAYTIAAWRENPIFGYGPDLWRGDMRLAFFRANGWAPGQAHNQFFQTLGQAGLVGVVTLMAYVGVLMYNIGRQLSVYKGVLAVAIAIMLFRGVTEFALQGEMFSHSFQYHFFVFGVLVLMNQGMANAQAQSTYLSGTPTTAIGDVHPIGR